MKITEKWTKLGNKKSHASPRKLARSVAHSQFAIQGFDNVDKPFLYKGHIAPSYFSTHWCEQVGKFHTILDVKSNKPKVIKNV